MASIQLEKPTQEHLPHDNPHHAEFKATEKINQELKIQEQQTRQVVEVEKKSFTCSPGTDHEHKVVHESHVWLKSKEPKEKNKKEKEKGEKDKKKKKEETKEVKTKTIDAASVVITKSLKAEHKVKDDDKKKKKKKNKSKDDSSSSSSSSEDDKKKGGKDKKHK